MSSGGRATDPTWSPDGSRVAFSQALGSDLAPDEAAVPPLDRLELALHWDREVARRLATPP